MVSSKILFLYEIANKGKIQTESSYFSITYLYDVTSNILFLNEVAVEVKYRLNPLTSP